MGMVYQFKRALRFPGRWSPASTVPQQALSCHLQCARGSLCLWVRTVPPTCGARSLLTLGCVTVQGLCLFRTCRLKALGQTALPRPLNPAVCLATARLFSLSIRAQVCCFTRQQFAGTWISLSLRRGWGSWELLQVVCVPLSPLAELPARIPHTFLAAIAQTRGSGSCRVHPFALISVPQVPPCA